MADVAAAPRRRIRRGTPNFKRFVINEYGTIGSRMKPPFTTIVKYDLNEPAIKWRIGFGDDPALVARGVTGTGVPQMRNSIIVTEVGSRARRRARQPDPCLGQRERQATVVVTVRRQLHRLAGDVRDGRPHVLAGPRRRLRTTKWPGRRRSRPGGAGWRADGLGRVFPAAKIAPRSGT